MGERNATDVASLASAYIDDLRAVGRSGSARSYAPTLAPLRAWHQHVAEVTPDDLRALIARRRTELSPSSLATFVSVLAAFFRWCHEEGYIAASPMQGVRRPRAARPPHHYLSTNQLRRCWDACTSDVDRTILTLCGGAGLRVSELLGIRWSDIDLDGATVRVIGKGDKPADVPLDPLALDVIARLPRTSKYVLARCRTRETVLDHVRRICERAGVPRVTTHQLRHSFACAWLEETGDAATLQELLRHSSPIMTRYYVRTVAQAAARRKARATNLTGRLFGE